MSKTDPENPPYITTSELLGKWYAIVMEYDGDSYHVTHTKLAMSKGDAWVIAQAWAASEGMEVR